MAPRPGLYSCFITLFDDPLVHLTKLRIDKSDLQDDESSSDKANNLFRSIVGFVVQASRNQIQAEWILGRPGSSTSIRRRKCVLAVLDAEHWKVEDDEGVLLTERNILSVIEGSSSSELESKGSAGMIRLQLRLNTTLRTTSSRPTSSRGSSSSVQDPAPSSQPQHRDWSSSQERRRQRLQEDGSEEEDLHIDRRSGSHNSYSQPTSPVQSIKKSQSPVVVAAERSSTTTVPPSKLQEAPAGPSSPPPTQMTAAQLRAKIQEEEAAVSSAYNSAVASSRQVMSPNKKKSNNPQRSYSERAMTTSSAFRKRFNNLGLGGETVGVASPEEKAKEDSAPTTTDSTGVTSTISSPSPKKATKKASPPRRVNTFNDDDDYQATAPNNSSISPPRPLAQEGTAPYYGSSTPDKQQSPLSSAAVAPPPPQSFMVSPVRGQKKTLPVRGAGPKEPARTTADISKLSTLRPITSSSGHVVSPQRSANPASREVVLDQGGGDHIKGSETIPPAPEEEKQAPASPPSVAREVEYGNEGGRVSQLGGSTGSSMLLGANQFRVQLDHETVCASKTVVELRLHALSRLNSALMEEEAAERAKKAALPSSMIDSRRGEQAPPSRLLKSSAGSLRLMTTHRAGHSRKPIDTNDDLENVRKERGWSVPLEAIWTEDPPKSSRAPSRPESHHHQPHNSDPTSFEDDSEVHVAGSIPRLRSQQGSRLERGGGEVAAPAEPEKGEGQPGIASPGKKLAPSRSSAASDRFAALNDTYGNRSRATESRGSDRRLEDYLKEEQGIENTPATGTAAPQQVQQYHQDPIMNNTPDDTVSTAASIAPARKKTTLPHRASTSHYRDIDDSTGQSSFETIQSHSGAFTASMKTTTGSQKKSAVSPKRAHPSAASTMLPYPDRGNNTNKKNRSDNDKYFFHENPTNANGRAQSVINMEPVNNNNHPQYSHVASGVNSSGFETMTINRVGSSRSPGGGSVSASRSLANDVNKAAIRILDASSSNPLGYMSSFNFSRPPSLWALKRGVSYALTGSSEAVEEKPFQLLAMMKCGGSAGGSSSVSKMTALETDYEIVRFCFENNPKNRRDYGGSGEDSAKRLPPAIYVRSTLY